MDEAVRFVETRLERNLINNHGSVTELLFLVLPYVTFKALQPGYDPGFTIDYHNSFIGGHSSGAHVPVAQLLVHMINSGKRSGVSLDYVSFLKYRLTV